MRQASREAEENPIGRKQSDEEMGKFRWRGTKKTHLISIVVGKQLAASNSTNFFTLLSRNDSPPTKKKLSVRLRRTGGDVNGSCALLLGTFFHVVKKKAKTNLLVKRNGEPEKSRV